MSDSLDSCTRRGVAGMLVTVMLLLAACEADDRADGQAPVPAQAEIERPRSAWGGAEVYDEVCDQCHKMGLDGAPELGDAAAWRPRIGKGTEVLYDHVSQGFNKMPARGGCSFCSDRQLREAMRYMIRNSGVADAAG